MQMGGKVLVLMEAINQNVMPSASDIKSGKETMESIKKKLDQTKLGACRKANCCQKKPKL
jgi:hypothetical protein